MKKYAALARVSSREQEREGFSLDVQEEALQRYAQSHGGEIVRFWKIAETASKRDERRAFKELLQYAKANAKKLDGVLFYKVDRAARNLFDYVEIERLEQDAGVEVVYVTQPTENTPAGRMLRRTLANMASFYTEQQSLDVKEGMARRVQNGLFVGKAPYGYRNVRVEGRGLVEVDPDDGPKIRTIYETYAFEADTLDALQQKLKAKGIRYTDRVPTFPRTKLHDILRSRAYIGDVEYRGQWYAGTHESLVSRELHQRVQRLLGGQGYNAHESVYGSGLVTCAECGRPLVAEVKRKRTKQGHAEYVYYRCARYTAPGHARVRVREEDLDAQLLKLWAQMSVPSEAIREWVVTALRAKAKDAERNDATRRGALKREHAQTKEKADRLLDLRLNGEIDEATFAEKHTELRDRLAEIALQIEAQSRSEAERTESTIRLFELSQALGEKWLTADVPEKRQLLQLVCLNLTLDGVSLRATMRKPFDVIAEGLVDKNGRGGRI